MVEIEEKIIGEWTRIFDGSSLEWFKKEFYDRYFLSSVRKLKAKEIANLVQGNMTVEQYAWRFMELGCFAPHLISTKELRAEHFQDGLQQYLQEQVVRHQVKNFQQLVDMASIIEWVYNHSIESPSSQKKRTYASVGSSSGSP